MKKPIVIIIILGAITILVMAPIAICITLPSTDELYYCEKPYDSLLVKIEDYYAKHPLIIENYGDTAKKDTIQKVKLRSLGRTDVLRFQIDVDTMKVVVYCQIYGNGQHSTISVRAYSYGLYSRNINWSSEHRDEQAIVLSIFEQQVLDQLECLWIRDWGQHWASIIAMYVIEWSCPITH